MAEYYRPFTGKDEYTAVRSCPVLCSMFDMFAWYSSVSRVFIGVLSVFHRCYRELADHLPSDCSLPDTQVYLVFHNCSLCFLFTVSTGIAVRRLRAKRSTDTQDFRVSLCFHRCDRISLPIGAEPLVHRKRKAEYR